MTDHSIPFDALDGKVGVLGATGSGKSYTAIGQVERLLDAGRQVIIVDPTGAYVGLRTAFPVPIFGGKSGDVPIAEADGERVARLVIDLSLSAIVDVSLLLKESHASARRFMAAFVATLKNAPTAPRYLVIDEADEFMPEHASGAVTQLFGDLKWIVRRGRIEGWRMLMVTQRPQDIAKSVLTQCETLIVHRLPSPQDRKAVEEWVKGHAEPGQAKEVLQSLASLETGEAWVWAPRHNVLVRAAMPTNRSEDRSRTPDADSPVEKVALKPVDVAALRAALTKPDDISAEIGNVGKSHKVVIEGVEHCASCVALEGQRDDLAVECEKLTATVERLTALTSEMKSRLDAVAKAIGVVRLSDEDEEYWADGLKRVPGDRAGGSPSGDAGETEGRQVMMSATPRPVARPVAAQTAIAKSSGGGNAPSGALPPRWRRILDALAWACVNLGRDEAERNIVAWFADVSPRSSSYTNDLSALRTRGFLDYPSSGMLALTDQGREVAAMPERAGTVDDRWRIIASRLQPRHARIVDAVRAVRRAERATIAEMAGVSPTSSSFTNDLSHLRTLGLIDYPASGVVGLGRVLA